MFGPPGSGKGTQAKLLRQTLEIAHISTGDMLRARVAAGDELGKEADRIMQTGNLVPDDVVNRMVEDRIEEPDCEKGFILDGFPRTVHQAQLLSGVLAGKGIDPLVVHLKVDYNVIIARLSRRRVCPACGALYSVTSNAPVHEACDYDGSKLVIREDDNPAVVGERLRAYERQTEPVLEFLKGEGYAFFEVEGADASPQAISRRISDLIEAERERRASLSEKLSSAPSRTPNEAPNGTLSKTESVPN